MNFDMRRAFVGFSSPIGYDYAEPAEKTKNDKGSSPNPILFGSMGIFTLYDEIWFACKSLCPNNMRELKYVKFLDEHSAKLNLREAGFKDLVDQIYKNNQTYSEPSLDDMFEQGYGKGISKYYGLEGRVDNHTHQLSFMDEEMGGNLGMRHLIWDLCLIDRFKELSLELVLNPLTAKCAFSASDQASVITAESLGLAEQVLTFGSFYDISGSAGPYHKCVEELRGDDLLVSFREWIRGQANSLHNQNMEAVQEEIDNTVKEFTNRTLRKSVDPTNTKNLVVKIAKNELLGKIPGGSAWSEITKAIAQNREADLHQGTAFVALARDKLSNLNSN